MQEKTTSKQNRQIWLLVLIFLGAILFLNWTFSFCSDDCIYGLSSTLGGNGVPQHLGTFSNAWIENWNDGYRPIVHIFVRIFTGCFDKWVFNIANTIMMAGLIVCMFRLSKGNFDFKFPSLVLLLTLVFFVLCKGESYLWCSGSGNYLWAGTGSLLFCIVLERIERKDTGRFEIAAYCAFAIIAGWLQEAFVLPICCALCVFHILHRESLTTKKVAVCICYMIGVALLVRVAGRRASTIPAFSPSTLLMTMIKVAAAIKGVWLLLAVFLFSNDKKSFIKRNLFSLLIVAASVCMIIIIGFNGERSLWSANLFSIIVVVRELVPSVRAAYAMSAILLVTLGICCFLGWRIKGEFNAFTKCYLSSENGLCFHNRVPCGPFARFFHQAIYTWEDGKHGKAYANFHGRDVSPVALPKATYDALLSEEFCIPTNRLATETEAFTTPQSNTIVVPLLDSCPTPNSVKVDYSFPQGFWATIQRELAIRKNPPVSSANVPRIIYVSGKRLALVSKIPNSDAYIRHITFGNTKGVNN